MMKKIFLLFPFLLLVMISCNKKPKEVYNPFATPEGCVKEYLEAKDSCDLVRMMKCYSYDPKYESVLREGLQEVVEKVKRHKADAERYEKIDSVKLKETYPNTAVVTVYYTFGSKTKSGLDVRPYDFDMNLIKDSSNWKLEANFSYSITIRQKNIYSLY